MMCDVFGQTEIGFGPYYIKIERSQHDAHTSSAVGNTRRGKRTKRENC